MVTGARPLSSPSTSTAPGMGCRPTPTESRRIAVKIDSTTVASMRQTLLHQEMGDVLGPEVAAAVLLAGKAQKGLDRVGDDTVEIEADLGRVQGRAVMVRFLYFSTLASSTITSYL